MKHVNILLLALLFPVTAVWSQKLVGPVAGKAVYFDVSPALRDRLLKPAEKTDKSWKDGFVPNILVISSHHENLENGIHDTVIQSKDGHAVRDIIVRNFDGLDNVNNVVPPDSHGDAGPLHYFQLVNLSFAIYDKTGSLLLGPLPTSSIWEGLPHNANNGDGVVLYDGQADRWLISQFSLPSFPNGPFYQMVAVSQTPDPTGAWYRWEFEFAELPDYPKFGVWPDGYYMSFTRLKSQTLQRDGVGAVVFNRNEMLTGEPDPGFIQFSITGADSPHYLMPSDCDGPFPAAGTPNYFGYVWNGSFIIREFSADWLNPQSSAFSHTLVLPVSPFAGFSLGGIAQKGSAQLLTAVDDRLMYRLQFRQFSGYQAMVVNHTVGVANHTGIRWYEFRKSTGNWFVHQQSTYTPDSLSRWMGSLAMDSEGNMALGYSVSGTSLYPSIRFTGRTKHDPPGQMTIGETSIMEGTGSQTGTWNGQSRWGDYSSMVVDPVDPSMFWYTQEYYATTSNNGWSTRIASLSYANVMDVHALALPEVLCSGDSSRLDVEVNGTSSGCAFQWTSEPPGFISSQRNPVVMPTSSRTYIVQVTSGTQVKTDSVALQVTPLPSARAGNDTTICRYLTEIPLAGTVANCSTVNWFTSGDGYFSNPASVKTTYHFGTNDKMSDGVHLKITAYPVVPCLPASSALKLTFDACAGVKEISGNEFFIRVQPNPVHDNLSVMIGGFVNEILLLTIATTQGKTLFSESCCTGNFPLSRQIDVSGFAPGVYFLLVQHAGAVTAKPFVVY